MYKLLGVLVLCLLLSKGDDDFIDIVDEEVENILNVNFETENLTVESDNNPEQLQSPKLNSTPSYWPQFDDVLIEDLGCGLENTMEGVLENVYDAFPWLVDVIDSEMDIMPGTLIAPDIVLTMASLLNNTTAKNLVVKAFGQGPNTLPYPFRHVKSIIRHPNYNTGIANNIALLVLEFEFNLQSNLRTICLPSPNANFDFSVCKSIAFSNGKHTQVNNQIIPSEACTRRLPDEYLPLQQKPLCAIEHEGSNQQSMMLGESLRGSPLICPMKGNPNRFTQLGIVYDIVGQTNHDTTGVFVNVTHLMSWIFQQLGPRKTDLKFYLP